MNKEARDRLIASLLKMQAEERANGEVADDLILVAKKRLGPSLTSFMEDDLKKGIADHEATKPAPEIGIELSEPEKVVLEGVLRFKSSYPNTSRLELMNALLRQRDQEGLSAETWAAAQKSLIHKGLLTPLGYLTVAGRAALERVRI